MRESAFLRIQPAEYYRRFLDFKIRPDGRHLFDTRSVKIRNNVLKSSLGSAIVSAGQTRFVAGVQAEIGPPLAGAPCSGRIAVNVEFQKSCGAEIEMGNNWLETDPGIIIGQILSSPKVFNLNDLCIKKGEAVWLIYINIICLEYDGNSVDWALLAAITALEDVRLPSVTWCEKSAWWRLQSQESLQRLLDDEGSLIHSKERQLYFINKPVSMMVSKLLNKFWVMDPTSQEELIGVQILFWKTSVDSQWQIFRSRGEPIDVSDAISAFTNHRCLQTRALAIEKALVSSNTADESTWYLCGTSDNEEDDELDSDMDHIVDQ